MTSIQDKIIKPKLGLLEPAKQLGSVSQACKVMGCSRDSCYRFMELCKQGGGQALMDLSRRKPILKNRVPEHVERAVIELAIENPAPGQKRASRELQQQGIMVSSSGVRLIWLRDGLEAMKKRLKALEGPCRPGRHPAHRGADGRAGEGPAEEGGAWRDRKPPSGLSRQPGHLLPGHDEGSGTHLPADLHRDLCAGGGR